MSDSTTIYIFRCEHKKWYVGKTSSLERRIEQHKNLNGSEWTKLHPVIEIVEEIPDCDPFDEDKHTLRYMGIYGIENVRGGSFCTTDSDSDTIKHIYKMIFTSTDCCYNCGETGHFIRECPLNNTANDTISGDCYVCKRIGHTAENCYAKKDTNGNKITSRDCCYRCGREGHWVLGCDQKTDIFGRECHHALDGVIAGVSGIASFLKFW